MICQGVFLHKSTNQGGCIFQSPIRNNRGSRGDGCDPALLMVQSESMYLSKEPVKAPTPQSIRPAIVTGDVDVSGYDTVYLGFPIWWYVAPTLINTFLV